MSFSKQVNFSKRYGDADSMEVPPQHEELRLLYFYLYHSSKILSESKRALGELFDYSNQQLLELVCIWINFLEEYAQSKQTLVWENYAPQSFGDLEVNISTVDGHMLRLIDYIKQELANTEEHELVALYPYLAYIEAYGPNVLVYFSMTDKRLEVINLLMQHKWILKDEYDQGRYDQTAIILVLQDMVETLTEELKGETTGEDDNWARIISLFRYVEQELLPDGLVDISPDDELAPLVAIWASLQLDLQALLNDLNRKVYQNDYILGLLRLKLQLSVHTNMSVMNKMDLLEQIIEFSFAEREAPQVILRFVRRAQEFAEQNEKELVKAGGGSTQRGTTLSSSSSLENNDSNVPMLGPKLKFKLRQLNLKLAGVKAKHLTQLDPGNYSINSGQQLLAELDELLFQFDHFHDTIQFKVFLRLFPQQVNSKKQLKRDIIELGQVIRLSMNLHD